MARRSLNAMSWPTEPIERLDLETTFMYGPDANALPPRWTWQDVRRAWPVLAPELEWAADSWAERTWGRG
jgi:hypothetical protein